MAVDLSAYAGKYSPQVLAAAQTILANKPDQVAANTGADGKFDLDGFINGTVGWWNENGHSVTDASKFQPELKLLDALGYAPSQTIPAEQALFKTILEKYIQPDINNDAARRLNAQGIVGNINRSLDNAQLINNETFGGVFDAADYLKQNPDLVSTLTDWVKNDTTGKFPNIEAAAKYHYDTIGKAQGRPATFSKSRLQLENEQAAATVAKLQGSASTAATQRLAAADQGQQLRLSAANEAAQTRLAALDQRKADLTSALTQMQGDRTGALDAQTAQLRTALSQLETERGAALKQLEDTRLEAAQTQVSGVNQALQDQQDRITATNAVNGFTGGSTAENTALARAAIGARQNAAEIVGGAKVTNATDRRGLGDDIANQRFGITGADATARRGIVDDTAKGRYDLANTTADSQVAAKNLLAGDTQTARGLFAADNQGAKYQLATDTQSATDKGTQLNQNYFDNDFGRRLQAALQSASIDTQRLGIMGAADDIGNTGLNRSLQTLNWFAGANNPPSSQPYTTTPSQAGADLANLGAGAIGSAFNLANANNWWQTPSKINPSTPTNTGTGYGLLQTYTPGVGNRTPFTVPATTNTPPIKFG